MKISSFFWHDKQELYPRIIEEAKPLHKVILEPLLNDLPEKRYLVTETANKVVDRIKIDKVDWSILEDIPEGVFESYNPRLPDVKHIWKKWDGWIFGVLLSREARGVQDYIEYKTYRINIKENYLPESSDYSQEVLHGWLKFFIFLYLSDVIVEHLESNGSKGTRKEGKVKNDTPYKVTIVDSKWNYIVVRSGSFQVSGHFRLQKFGKGLSEAKLIYIDEFEKTGYKRNIKRNDS